MITNIVNFIKLKYLVYKINKIQKNLHNLAKLNVYLSSSTKMINDDKVTCTGWVNDIEKDIHKLNEIKNTIQKEALI